MNITRLKEARTIEDNKRVRLKEAGNIYEVMCSETKSHGGYIRKVSKDEYIDIRSGEVKNFSHIENRSQDLSNVAKSLAQGRDLLNANITDVTRCRWITLTYRENMTDQKRLLRDFQIFVRACRKRYGHFEYIIAAEPQGRGAWHLHCVFIFDHTAPYMENAVVAELWKQGFVTVKRLDDVDNVGAYLTAYLGDLDLSECEAQNIRGTVKEVEYTDENGLKQTKKYIKGARLHLYPPGMHIFRWSQGIKKPIISEVAYSEAKEKISGATLTFSKSVSVDDDVNDYHNTLTYEYYNRARTNCRDKSSDFVSQISRKEEVLSDKSCLFDVDIDKFINAENKVEFILNAR